MEELPDTIDDLKTDLRDTVRRMNEQADGGRYFELDPTTQEVLAACSTRIKAIKEKLRSLSEE
jgi:hypothetical protein